MSLPPYIMALFFLAPLCSAHIGGLQLSTQDVNPRVYCGRALARMIANICYDDPAVDKRSESGTMFGALIPPYYKEQDGHAGWPWMVSSSKARSMGSSRGKRFTNGGIADECCEKPCSISELLYYC